MDHDPAIGTFVILNTEGLGSLKEPWNGAKGVVFAPPNGDGTIIPVIVWQDDGDGPTRKLGCTISELTEIPKEEIPESVIATFANELNFNPE